MLSRCATVCWSACAAGSARSASRRASAFSAAFFVALPAKNIFSRLPARSASSASGAVRAVKSCSGPRRVAAVPSAARIAARVASSRVWPGSGWSGSKRKRVSWCTCTAARRAASTTWYTVCGPTPGTACSRSSSAASTSATVREPRPFQLVESHSPAGDLLERTERLLPQTGRDGLGIEDLDLLPGALAQRNWCAEQCGGPQCEAADGFEGGLRSCADPGSRGRDRPVVDLLLSRHVPSAPSAPQRPGRCRSIPDRTSSRHPASITVAPLSAACDDR